MSDKNKLKLNFCGIPFSSPVVLLSGCAGFGNEYTRVDGYTNYDVGAVCLKALTIKPRIGNLPPRLYETSSGLLNSIGLQNPGIDYFLSTIIDKLQFLETNYIANIYGFSILEYVQLSERINDTNISAIELNLSCPNVRGSRLEVSHTWEFIVSVIEACRKITEKPLIAKLSSTFGLMEVVRKCIDAGVDAFAITNTVPGMAIDIKTEKPVLGAVQGGLSGGPIKPIALLSVKTAYEVCKKHNIPIIGQGGISNANDAIEFLLVGATAVGIGTGLFANNLLANKINEGIIKHIKQTNRNHVSDIIGKGCYSKFGTRDAKLR